MPQNLAIWLFLRFLTSFWVAIISTFHPLSLSESTLPLIPPDVLKPAWLERVFLAPWSRWDVNWYLQIVISGYQSSDGTLQFHPLFPWLASILYRLGFNPLFALLCISSASAFGLFIALERLARLDFSEEDSRQSVLILAFFPLSVILFAPYSESLFLLCSVLCFYAARKRSWLVAGIAGFLASLTRQQGLFLIVPIVWEIWEASSRNWKKLIASFLPWTSPALTLGGFLAWVVIRRSLFSENLASHQGVNAWIYSFLVSPSANQVVPQQAFIPPWQALALAAKQFITSPDLDMSFNFLFSGLFILMFVFSWKTLQISYRLFCLVILLVSFSYYTGAVHPTMGLPRHLLLAFPVFIGIAPSMRHPWLRLAYAGFGLISMLALLTGYVMEAWVP